MSRQLPSIELLQAFLTVAKTGNFGQAGELLNLSQSAVSRQVAQLESRVETRLFDRHTRKIVLTAEGRALVPVAEQVIGLLSDASHMLATVGRSVSLRAHPTMAARWLIPRLTAFYQVHPEVTVSVDTVYHRFPDFAFESIDAMIAYGTATWPDFEALDLWEEELIPVCSPQLLTGTTPEALLKTARLVDSSMDRLDWRRWDEYYPNSTGTDNPHLTFDTLESAIVAVKCGQGIALVDAVLTQDELRSGQLTRVHAGRIVTGGRYTLVYPKRVKRSSGFCEFLGWLEQEMAASSH
ncbi:LysR substrate-binding domain-containing protein [Pseudomonas sp. 14P_8.1_Bac3]|uniref:LysR substrate-binding domain-containing protein n=1 Tax=Pseudomonas sp. 14P_8.1_Bac3 TaxID=2971621 RepID=UPI0021CA9337|nr:LysR substrate-binding domain-containing protein [Pseudomonas sp. 14P_8.1_Bac3]MCU1758508.1 LysR substrate-binding domain-containing protein [Pseudomonas sp. 14P_8.1_Bac3]